MRRQQVALTVLFSLGRAQTADADEARDAAGAHYARGLELASGGGYEGALAEFNAAYTISPQFTVLYNIGQAQVALDHPTQAIVVLTAYLSEGKDRIPDLRRQKVQAQIASLSSRLATLSITTDRSGAHISVDERDVGATPLAEPVRVDAGTHTISAKVDGIPVAIRIVTLGVAERKKLYLDLPPPSSNAAATAARESVAKAMAAAAAASRAAAEANIASRAAAAALERERALSASRIYSYQAARGAAAQAEHERTEMLVRSRATPGGGGR